MGYPVGNPSAEYERIICERARRDYVVVGETDGHAGVGRVHENEAVNLKIDRDSLDSSVHESAEKKD